MSDISVTFIKADGDEVAAAGTEGMNLLELAQGAGVDIEGACEGNMACSTCHLVIEPCFFDRIPEASEDEEEMLDLASGLKPTSRLGCQVLLTPDLHGMKLYVPKESRNMMGL